MNSQTILNDKFVERRSANYQPNIWSFDVIQSLTSDNHRGENERLVTKLKNDVKQLFIELKDHLTRLELMDCVTKLGLAYLFEDEINNVLRWVAVSDHCESNINVHEEDDLYVTALHFRLLRQNGRIVSQDMFVGFIDENGNFMKTKCMDLKGLLELYEASNLGFDGENVMDVAKEFSIKILKKEMSNPNLDGEIRKQIGHALDLSSHKRIAWFNVKWYINIYEKTNTLDAVLIHLAKLNFNIVQTHLQKDLKEVSRWWSNLNLMKDLNFTRDRLVESFLCTVGLTFEPQHTRLRKWLTKVVTFILLIDDIYDVYGSLEELNLFTMAVNQWDISYTEHLPRCMIICFQALHDVVNEIVVEIHEANRLDHQLVLFHLKKVWADFCKSLYQEAKWYNERYTPSLEEYLRNAWISSSGVVISIHSIFAITNDELIDNKTMEYFLDKNRDIIYNQSLIIRLCNDLSTSTAERERGDVASSITCYIREANNCVSDEEAKDHIEDMINKSWKKLNGEICLTKSSSLLQSCFNMITGNAARMAHVLYEHGDGFGVQDRQTKSHILSLLVKPFNL